VWLKTLVVSCIFLVTLFFAVEKRVTGSKRFDSKNHHDGGAKRFLYPLNRAKSSAAA
jgi:hypothetical protein